MATPTIESRLKRRFIVMSGDESLRDARLARADRFFERAEIATKPALFCEQFGWGSAQ